MATILHSYIARHTAITWVGVTIFILIVFLFTNVIRHAGKSIGGFTKSSPALTVLCTSTPLAPNVWRTRLLTLTLQGVEYNDMM